MLAIEKILLDVLALKSEEKLALIDKVLTSLHPVNKGVDNTWSEEVDERVKTFNDGHIPATDEQDVFAKYDKLS